MAALDGTERSLRVQDKSKVRSFSCFDEILAGHSACPIFCKVADLQKGIDLRDERIEQLQSDVEKKDEDILTLKASLRCREADIDFLQADAGYWRRQLENHLDVVRIACTNPLTPPISMCPDAIPMPGRAERSRSRARSPAYSPVLHAP